MHREKTSYLAGIYTSREEFMPRWNSCIAEIMHHESLIMHDEKISCLVKIYAWREEFMPRQNLHIARRFYSSLKVMHREKIHISREFTYRGKIFMPRKRTYMDKERAILIHWPRLHSVISYENKHQGEHRRWRQKRHQYRFNIYLFILASTKEYIEDCIAKHKAWALFAGRQTGRVDVEYWGEQWGVDMVKRHCLPSKLHF